MIKNNRDFEILEQKEEALSMPTFQKEGVLQVSREFTHWGEGETVHIPHIPRHSFFLIKGYFLSTIKRHVFLPRKLVNSFVETVSKGLKNLWSLKGQTIQLSEKIIIACGRAGVQSF